MKRNIPVLTNVLSSTMWLMSLRVNKSKQQDGFHVHKVIIFLYIFFTVFFFIFPSQ